MTYLLSLASGSMSLHLQALRASGLELAGLSDYALPTRRAEANAEGDDAAALRRRAALRGDALAPRQFSELCLGEE